MSELTTRAAWCAPPSERPLDCTRAQLERLSDPSAGAEPAGLAPYPNASEHKRRHALRGTRRSCSAATTTGSCG